MVWLEFSIEASAELAPVLEDFLLEQGAQAVTLQDLTNQAIFEPELGTTPLWTLNKVTGLFDDELDAQYLFSEMKKSFGKDAPQNFLLQALEDRDWQREWLKYYQAMCFGKRLWIIPSEELLAKNQNPVEIKSGQIVLAMDPGLAFGTGTHETTALCLEWLAEHDLTGKKLVDFGCGSGILGIAASLLGCASVWATDIDPQAILASKENAQRNHVYSKMHIVDIETFEKQKHQQTFDIVVANILAGPLQKLSSELANLLASGGIIVLSGILVKQAEELARCYQPCFDNIELTYKNDWTRLVARKK